MKEKERDAEDLLEKVLYLCRRVREAARPMLGTRQAGGIEGRGASGDATFGIDETAERVVEKVLEGESGIAYYTEDRGLVIPEKPEYLLIIDPVDGTRPAAAGLEACCVSIAAAPYKEGDIRMEDVFLGAVQEIKNDAIYYAVKGGGATMEFEGSVLAPTLSTRSEIGGIFWTLGFRGRPAVPLTCVLGEMIDMTSVEGGCFDLGSAAFGIMHVVAGGLDVYVDVGQRMADEVETVRELFLEVGGGAILNNYPYDLAASVLIADECGACCTDAYGRTLDSYPLIPSGGGGQISAVVSGNETLHRKVIELLDLGMARLKDRYEEV